MFFTDKNMRFQETGSRTSNLERSFTPKSFSFERVGSQRFTGFASLTLGIPGQARDQSRNSESIQEPATGLYFAREYCTRGEKNCSSLAAVGVRAKRILGVKNVNVYAVGLYVDASAAKARLSNYKGKSADDLVNNSQFYREFIAADGIEKTVRLKISYNGITRGAFWKALKERLEPPLEKAGEISTLEKFGGQFETVAFHRGLDIAFTCKGMTTVTRVDGREVGAITSAALTEALLGVYMGDSPVSQGAKENFGRGLAGVLNEA
uniref:Chalcone-flavonone isomerase family protein n=1 Tax=Tetraselmis sp. GSL018 TaxID=582737 RepID=A0A061RGD1_9CHLO